MFFAKYWSNIDLDSIKDIVRVLPIFTRQGNGTRSLIQYRKGAVKVNQDTHFNGPGSISDFVFTGPPMMAVYGECRWNKLVLAVQNNMMSEAYQFHLWLNKLFDILKEKLVELDPSYARSISDPLIYDSLTQSSYYKELRCRLATTTDRSHGDGNESQIVTAFLYKDKDDGEGWGAIRPSEVKARSLIYPVFKVNYYRAGDHVGLVLTILKARVIDPEPQLPEDNSKWLMDYA